LHNEPLFDYKTTGVSESCTDKTDRDVDETIECREEVENIDREKR
jgi:hypothetical protein